MMDANTFLARARNIFKGCGDLATTFLIRRTFSAGQSPFNSERFRDLEAVRDLLTQLKRIRAFADNVPAGLTPVAENLSKSLRVLYKMETAIRHGKSYEDYRVELQQVADADLLSISGMITTTRKHRKKTAKKRSWTQPDLDEAIREYKAKRASRYSDLVDGAKRGQRGAKKAARELFGRNVIVRALGVKSGAMVTNSPAWQEIADELDLRERAGKSRRTPVQRIGMEIALEEQAVATGESAVDQVVRRETIALVQESMPALEAEATIEKLQHGEITDDQARELIDVSADQKQDDRMRRIRQGL